MSSSQKSKKPKASGGKNVLQMKTEIEDRLLKDCKLDACVSKFVVQLFQHAGEKDFKDRWRRTDWSRGPREFEESKFQDLEAYGELKSGLKEDLNHLVPGYVKSDDEEWLDQELRIRIACYCQKITDARGWSPKDRDEAHERLLVAVAKQHWEKRKAAREAGSLQKTAEQEAFRQLSECIAGADSAADFACGGSIPVQKRETAGQAAVTLDSSLPVDVYWSAKENLHLPLSLPLAGTSQENHRLLEQLVSDCSPATFGKGQEDVLDPTYRSAGKLDTSQFSTTFSPEEFGILRQIEQILLPSIELDDANHPAFRQVVAKLYKLNIYSGPSGIFKKHVDTPRGESQFGSLVVCLPSEFEGGNLLVQHGEHVIDYNWSANSASSIQWAAFYSDCEHEIKTVSKGHRITLTYNLHIVESLGLALSRSPLVPPSGLAMYEELKSLLEQPGFLKTGGVVGIFCAHAYPHAAGDASRLLPRSLKGSDLMVHSTLSTLGCHVEIHPVLEFDDTYNTAGKKFTRYAMKYLKECEKHGKKPKMSFKETLEDRFVACDDLETRWKILFMGRNVKSPPGYYWSYDSSYKDSDESDCKDDSEGRYESSVERWRSTGACIGRALHPYRAVSQCIEEPDNWDWILKSDWKSDWLPDIKWLTEPKHPQMAITYATYGNEPSTGTSYSCAAIIAVIPSWEERMETLRNL